MPRALLLGECEPDLGTSPTGPGTTWSPHGSKESAIGLYASVDQHAVGSRSSSCGAVVFHARSKAFAVAAGGYRSDCYKRLFSCILASLSGEVRGGGLVTRSKTRDVDGDRRFFARARYFSDVEGHVVHPEGAGGMGETASANPARLLIADDHALVREGLRAMLSGGDGIRVVAEAKDGQ